MYNLTADMSTVISKSRVEFLLINSLKNQIYKNLQKNTKISRPKPMKTKYVYFKQTKFESL